MSDFAMTKLENFERSMLDGFGSCRMFCKCGKTYYDPIGIYTWEKGELDALRADPNAVSLDYGPSRLSFEGNDYVDACDCWHARAKQIIGFIDSHAHKIAAYLTRERARKFAEANASPTIESAAPGATDRRGQA